MAIQSAEAVREFLIPGLRNAHAMESQAISLTTAQADRLKHYADLEQRVREHVRETEGQRDRLERCLEKFGTGASTLKDAALKAGPNLQMMLHGMASDEVVKNVLASFAFEQFEIITYKALIETASLAGEADVVAICKQKRRKRRWPTGSTTTCPTSFTNICRAPRPTSRRRSSQIVEAQARRRGPPPLATTCTATLRRMSRARSRPAARCRHRDGCRNAFSDPPPAGSRRARPRRLPRAACGAK